MTYSHTVNVTRSAGSCLDDGDVACLKFIGLTDAGRRERGMGVGGV